MVIANLHIDDDADLDKAIRVAVNAKTQRYGTCCTLESLLVAESIADQVLPPLAKILQQHEVEIRGCSRSNGADQQCGAGNRTGLGNGVPGAYYSQ